MHGSTPRLIRNEYNNRTFKDIIDIYFLKMIKQYAKNMITPVFEFKLKCFLGTFNEKSNFTYFQADVLFRTHFFGR
jgi:hypothetical protein